MNPCGRLAGGSSDSYGGVSQASSFCGWRVLEFAFRRLWNPLFCFLQGFLQWVSSPSSTSVSTGRIFSLKPRSHVRPVHEGTGRNACVFLLSRVRARIRCFWGDLWVWNEPKAREYAFRGSRNHRTAIPTKWHAAIIWIPYRFAVQLHCLANDGETQHALRRGRSSARSTCAARTADGASRVFRVDRADERTLGQRRCVPAPEPQTRFSTCAREASRRLSTIGVAGRPRRPPNHASARVFAPGSAYRHSAAR